VGQCLTVINQLASSLQIVHQTAEQNRTQLNHVVDNQPAVLGACMLARDNVSTLATNISILESKVSKSIDNNKDSMTEMEKMMFGHRGQHRQTVQQHR
jgi:ABC-type transporter Mla subunit MlaD